MASRHLEWERQSDETEKAYAAFRVYRDMGAQRSLEQARLKLEKPVGYMRVLEAWSSQHQWVKRCLTYDRYIAAKLDAALETRLISEQEKLIRAEIEAYHKMLSKFDEVWERTRLHDDQRSKRKPKDGDSDEIEVITVKLNIREWMALTEWRKSISDFGRRPLGMPKEITETKHGFGDGQKPKRIVFEWDDDSDNSGHSDD